MAHHGTSVRVKRRTEIEGDYGDGAVSLLLFISRQDEEEEEEY